MQQGGDDLEKVSVVPSLLVIRGTSGESPPAFSGFDLLFFGAQLALMKLVTELTLMFHQLAVEYISLCCLAASPSRLLVACLAEKGESWFKLQSVGMQDTPVLCLVLIFGHFDNNLAL